MHVRSLSAAVALWAGSASAFYPYMMEGSTGATHRPHPGRDVARAFALGGEDNALVRTTLRKRDTKGRMNTFAKRENDFDVLLSDNTSGENTTPIHQDGTDLSYFAELNIGTNPGQSMYLLLDTGSSSMWVMGGDCRTAACETHSTFDRADSTTLETSTQPFAIGYNTGEVAGLVVTDTIEIAGLSFEMRFGMANTTSEDFERFPMDGILGMARSSEGSGLQAPTFLSTLSEAGLIERNVFGMSLNRASDGEADGHLIFGGVDDSLYTGEINYVATTGDEREWRIPVDGMEIGGQRISVPDNRAAIIDSGTTFAFIGASDAEALWSTIEGATLGTSGNWHVPCDTNVDVALVFGGVAYSISPADYLGNEAPDGLCYTHLIGSDASGEADSWLIGDTFLKNVYAVFDMDEGQIGFAPQAAEGASEPPSTTTATTSSEEPSATSSTAAEDSSSTTSSSDSSATAPASDDGADATSSGDATSTASATSDADAPVSTGSNSDGNSTAGGDASDPPEGLVPVGDGQAQPDTTETAAAPESSTDSVEGAAASTSVSMLALVVAMGVAIGL